MEEDKVEEDKVEEDKVFETKSTECSIGKFATVDKITICAENENGYECKNIKDKKEIRKVLREYFSE